MPRAFALSCIVTLSACSGGGSGTTTGTSASGSTSATGTTSGTGTGSGTTSGTVSGATSGTTSGSSGAPVCGNGVVEAGEVCDLGTLNGTGVGCNATCNLRGLVSTIAGNADAGLQDGTGAGAEFDVPNGVAVLNGAVYVADGYYRAIRQVDPATGVVVTIAGGTALSSTVDQNGIGDAGTFDVLNALATFDGGLLATDASCVRFVTTEGEVTDFAGQLATNGIAATGVDAGPFASALFGVPQGIAVEGQIVYTDTTFAGVVLASNAATEEVGVLSTFESTFTLQLGGMTALNGLIYVDDEGATGTLFVLDGGGGIENLSLTLNAASGICNDGRSIYICEAGTNSIRQYDPVTGTLSLLAGGAGTFEKDGLGIDAGFNSPAACAWDSTLGRLYVTDMSGDTLRIIE